MDRYYAKPVHGLGYIFDRLFSCEAPIVVVRSIAIAQIIVKAYNKELN